MRRDLQRNDKVEVLQTLSRNGMDGNPEACSKEHIDWSEIRHGGGGQDDDEDEHDYVYDDNEDDRDDDDAVSRSLVFNMPTEVHDQRVPLSLCYFYIFALLMVETVGYLKFSVELENDLDTL